MISIGYTHLLQFRDVALSIINMSHFLKEKSVAYEILLIKMIAIQWILLIMKAFSSSRFWFLNRPVVNLSLFENSSSLQSQHGGFLSKNSSAQWFFLHTNTKFMDDLQSEAFKSFIQLLDNETQAYCARVSKSWNSYNSWYSIVAVYHGIETWNTLIFLPKK